jgi:hypothetical protein
MHACLSLPPAYRDPELGETHEEMRFAINYRDGGTVPQELRKLSSGAEPAEAASNDQNARPHMAVSSSLDELNGPGGPSRAA